MKKIVLFCLSHAGSSSSGYLSWKTLLHDDINIVPIELAGRGRRYTEPFYSNMEEAIDDIFDSIKEHLASTNRFAIWGHSMGSTIAYELCYKIYCEVGLHPVHLFISGRPAPHFRNTTTSRYKLNDNDFIDSLLNLGGLPKEFLQNDELMNLYLPVLRADFRLLDSYHKKNDHRFKCGLTLLSGKSDASVRYNELLEWKTYTDSKCEVYLFNGGHFYLNNFRESITEIINRKLINE